VDFVGNNICLYMSVAQKTYTIKALPQHGKVHFALRPTPILTLSDNAFPAGDIHLLFTE
jgi:hypothetical protein